MYQRAVQLPAGVDSVWRAITDPGAVEEWFGASVVWDLRPGGGARFHPLAGGADWEGVIDAVDPGRTLRFRWWSVEGGGEASEIAYELEADEQGTTLTVTERQVLAPAEAAGSTPSAGLAAPAGPVTPVAAGAGMWSVADQAQWEMWAGSASLTGRAAARCSAR